FSDEPSIMRYIKIAATLRDKTVRDVALRCRWMARKRRKPDDSHMGKKLKDKKDLVELYSKPCMSSSPTLNVAPFSVTMNNQAQIDGTTFEALNGSIRHLLEQNNQVLGQISANISSMKLQENFDLFSHMKNNINAILNEYGKCSLAYYLKSIFFAANTRLI
nr:homeodomain-like protein [Tanacetum cinerariifolium]